MISWIKSIFNNSKPKDDHAVIPDYWGSNKSFTLPTKDEFELFIKDANLFKIGDTCFVFHENKIIKCKIIGVFFSIYPKEYYSNQAPINLKYNLKSKGSHYTGIDHTQVYHNINDLKNYILTLIP